MKTLTTLLLIILSILLTACSNNMSSGSAAKKSMMAMPFGTAMDTDYAQQLWQALNKAKLAGNGAIETVPYKGQPPHGAVLETFNSHLSVAGHNGVVYVKRNYGGKDITRSRVVNNRGKYLKAITVMFKREKGYDPENKDWFWAKYKPDGSLHSNPKGMLLAGRVAKGMNMGCIACHRAAPGGDYLFNNTAAQLDH